MHSDGESVQFFFSALREKNIVTVVCNSDEEDIFSANLIVVDPNHCLSYRSGQFTKLISKEKLPHPQAGMPHWIYDMKKIK